MIWNLILLLTSLSLLMAQERLPGKPQALPSDPIPRSKEAVSSQKHTIEEAQRQVIIAPDSAEAYFKLGEAYRNGDGNAEAAAQAFKRALLLKPEYAEAYLGLAWAYGILNQNESEVQALEHAVRLNANDAEAYCRLGDAYSTFDSGKWIAPVTSEDVKRTVEVVRRRAELAAAAYERAIRIRPDYAKAYAGLGSTYLALQQNKEAIEAYKQAIEYDAHNPLIRTGLGYVYLASGDYEASSEQHKIAIHLIENMEQHSLKRTYEIAAALLFSRIQERRRNER